VLSGQHEENENKTFAINILATKKQNKDSEYDTAVNFGKHTTVDQRNEQMTEESLQSSFGDEYLSIMKSIQDRVRQHLQTLHQKPPSFWKLITQIFR
jgi:hypothetical protein